MSIPPGSTENRIPHTPGAVERVRLLDKLEAASQYRLTLVSAPPGYGKTTAVAQFACRARYPVAWHTIVPRERDVPNLHSHSLSALEALTPGISEALSAPGDRPPSELASLVAEHLRNHLTQDALYILDDVHHLTGSPAAETWLRNLAERLPRSCHLILISRTLPTLPFAELIARSEVLAFGQEELRLSEDEIEELAHQLLADRLSSAEMQGLVARLDGWPAGIMLALQPLPSGLSSMLSAGAGPEALFETLARSMLNAQLPDLRQFLLASSTLPRLTPELCSAVLGLANSADMLPLALTRNLFLTRMAGGLVYHPLFRDFLQQQLRVADPGQYAALHLEAARWFEAREEVEEAFEQYMTAGQPERARDLAERVAPAYFTQGKFETMLSWSAQLNEAGVLAPVLAHECAILLTDRYEYAEAEAELARAREGFAGRGDPFGLTKVDLQQARITLQQGHYQEALALARQAIHSELPELRGRALRVIGLAYLRLGEVASGVAYLEEALGIYRAAGLVSSLSHLLQDLQFAYTRLGRLEEAGSCLQEVVAIRRKLGGAGALALALNNLGYYYHQRSDYHQAELTFQEALNVIRGISDRWAESGLLWSLGDLKRDLGAFEEAQRLFDKALELSPAEAEPALYSAILVSIATLRRWQGKTADAALLAEEALSVAEGHGIAFEATVAQAALWAARARHGEAEQALAGLEAAATALNGQGARFEQIGVKGLCAGVCLLRDDREAAGRYLQEALAVAQEVGSAQPLAAEMAHNPALENLAAGRDGFDQALRDLAQLREAQRETSPAPGSEDGATPVTTFSLRVQTLGPESVERDGVPIPVSEWRAAGARELFLYLLFSGPKSRGELSLVFWPDSSPDQVRANFHTTLHRARQPLGADVIRYQNDLYFIDPDLDVWCDALELERWVSQARLLPPQDARAADLWQRAVSLYQGDFLCSLDTDWVIAQREKLQELHLEALVGSGQSARVRRDFQTALELFNRAFSIDPYREDVHRAVMRCYQEMGERSQVLTYYNQLKRLLSDDLGVEPSEETVALANSLLN